MALYRRKGSPFWWLRFTHRGRRISKSAGTSDRERAQQFHDKLKADLWAFDRLGEKPRYTWADAVKRFLKETSDKASHQDDIRRLRWLDQYLGQLYLDEITRGLIDELAQAKRREASAATANRHLAIVRTILRRAWIEWEWIDRAPKVRLFPEPKRRVRFLTRQEAERLLAHLPPHQADMARLALATGLRQANILKLEWSQIDLDRRVAWIHPDQAKARHAIAVPLNDEALEVVRRQIGRHKRRVFTYQRAPAKPRPGKKAIAIAPRPVDQVNTKAWKNALARAGIENFRWHDLRHTWASWHAMAGTSMAELQELGGWESATMVRRYAHLSAEHLAAAAARISVTGTKLATDEVDSVGGVGLPSANPLMALVGGARFELATNGLKGAGKKAAKGVK